jgi:hypothetical protein
MTRLRWQVICNARFLALLFFLSIASTCIALPAGSPRHPPIQEASSSSHVKDDAKLPPLSHYSVSKAKDQTFKGHYISVDEPDWDKYAFHMVKDHPINAEKHRTRLHEDLKNEIIDNYLHDKEIKNSLNREMAVKHILHGGMVYDHEARVVIHPDYIKSESLRSHDRGMNIAQIFNEEGKTEQTFVLTQNHILHVRKEKKRQMSRYWDLMAFRQHLGTGKQRDLNLREASNVNDLRGVDGETTPPPSPPRSPSPPPQKKFKIVWQ